MLCCGPCAWWAEKSAARPAQVSVINTEDYVIPEGQRVQPGSRKWKRHEQFPPRAELRAQANADLLAALAQEQPAMAA